MRLAAIADTHGNYLALEAVLADIETQHVDLVVNLGDHVSGPLEAGKTLDLLMARDFPTIRGNHDRWVVEQAPEDMGPSDRVAYDQLTAEHLDWLRALPATQVIADDVFLCHGTPTRDTVYWLECVDPDGRVMRRDKAAIEAEAAGLHQSLLLCAHTHLPRAVRLDDERLIVNPGSVGCPAYDDDKPVPHVVCAGTPHASYAVLEKAAQGWSAAFRLVPYDNRAMADLARDRGRPEWALGLATGWIT